MNFLTQKPTLSDHIYWFLHPQYYLLEVFKGGKEVATAIYRRRLAIRIARHSKAIHWMLYRRTAWGQMGRLILESHETPEPTDDKD